MKISRVTFSRHRQEFTILAGRRAWVVPFQFLRLRPTREDPVVDASPDHDLGGEGFTYRLASGAQDTVHLDDVLHINRDPEYGRQQLLYGLTTQAQDLLRGSGLAKRQVCRRLATSPAQLQRLLDPTFGGKTIDQMVRLLQALGHEVTFSLHRAA
jgi:hypothetical protein